jgi:hypothetical protein
MKRHDLGDGIAFVDDFAKSPSRLRSTTLQLEITGTNGSGFSAFITSPRHTKLRVSGSWRGSVLTLMVREAWTM